MPVIARSSTYIRYLPSSSSGFCLECGAPLGRRMRFFCSAACRKKGSRRRRSEERRMTAPARDFPMGDPWGEGRLGAEVTRNALLDGWSGNEPRME